MKIKRIHSEVKLPSYATAGSVGLDLYMPIKCIMPAGVRARLGCGIAIELPVGCEGQIRPRSSLSAAGLDIFLGTIDNDYRGELLVVVHNRNTYPYIIEKGECIAQLVVSPIVQVVPVEVSFLSETERGAGGFGSTGV